MSCEELERKRARESSQAGHLKKRMKSKLVLSEEEQAFETWFYETIGHCDISSIKRIACLAWVESRRLYKEKV